MSPADRLAALRDGTGHRRADKTVRVPLPDLGVKIELPAPVVSARVFAVEALTSVRELFAVGTYALAGRPPGTQDPPEGVELDDLVAELADALRALPDRPDAGEFYKDLRLLVVHAAPHETTRYLSDVVRAVRRRLPEWSPPRPKRVPRPPAKSATQRKRDHRATVASDAEKTAEWWLREHLRAAQSGRVAASDLWQKASSDLATVVEEAEDDLEWWAEDAAEVGAPVRPRVPGRNQFYAVADRLLGPRRTGQARAQFYVYPEAPVTDRDALSENLLDRMARIAWEEQREHLLAYLTRRDAQAAATGTDGNVIAFRSRR